MRHPRAAAVSSAGQRALQPLELAAAFADRPATRCAWLESLAPRVPVEPSQTFAEPRGAVKPSAAQAVLRRHGAVLRTWTEIPASSGLAGSSVLVLAVLAALRAFFTLEARRYNDYVLAEIAQRAEEHDPGVVCGFADRPRCALATSRNDGAGAAPCSTSPARSGKPRGAGRSRRSPATSRVSGSSSTTTNALDAFIHDGGVVYAHPVSERIDVTTPADIVSAEAWLRRRRSRLR